MSLLLKRFLITIFFIQLLISPVGIASNLNPDSIKQLVESANEEQRLEVLLSSSEQILNKYPEQAAIYAQRALLLAKERGNEPSIAKANILLARAKYIIGHYNLALEHLDSAHNTYLNQSDSLNLTESYQLYGLIYTRVGDFKKALDNAQRAFDLARNIKSRKKLAELSREIGNIYFYFGERAIALDFFQKSLNLSQQYKDNDGIAKAYNNMGRIYAELGRYNIALEYLKKSLDSKVKEDDRVSYGNTLLNIGTVYLKKEDFTRALEFFEESRVNFSSVNNAEGTANSLYYLGITYYRLKRFNQALALQNEAWEIVTKTNTKRLMVNVSQAIADIYESIGDYQKAYQYIQTYLDLRDSVFSDEKSRLLIELETRYQLHTKQRQIELLSKERALEESERTRIRVLIALLSIVASLFITLTYFAYTRFRYKSKANEELIKEISYRKRIEAQLNEYQDQLENLVEERTWELKVAKDKAEESDMLKTAFLTNMSHEIRTPMNAIVGFSYLLTDKESTAEAKAEYIKIIKSNGEVLMNLINDILDISIIEAGQLKMKSKPFVLAELLDELKFFFNQEFEKQGKKDIELTCDYDSACPNLVINTDKIRLRQVVSNLLWNALKFTFEGKITFGFRLSGTEELIFYVKDTGIGIEPDKHELIFDRFSKFNVGSDSSLYSGTGLGLAICRELVGALGGGIWLDSIPGRGSTFYFTIPYEANGHSHMEPSLANFKVNKDVFSGKTILIAEDVVSNYKLLEAFLANLNMNILWAKDGIQAIKLFRENPTINIILMDIQMPIMDGLNAVKNIRKLNTSVPIIVNTAFYMTDEMEQSIEAGSTDYMSKPIRKEDLLIKLTLYLS
jgi:signal transduction histidine kinase